MIMQIHTEKELIEIVGALKKEVDKLAAINKLNAKQFKLMQAEIDKKPKIIKELTTHEVKTVDSARKKQIEDLKKSISSIEPVINNITQGINSDDVLELINKHVTTNYINKLYKKG